jgi:hypothetical protein
MFPRRFAIGGNFDEVLEIFANQETMFDRFGSAVAIGADEQRDENQGG